MALLRHPQILHWCFSASTVDSTVDFGSKQFQFEALMASAIILCSLFGVPFIINIHNAAI